VNKGINIYALSETYHTRGESEGSVWLNWAPCPIGRYPVQLSSPLGANQVNVLFTRGEWAVVEGDPAGPTREVGALHLCLPSSQSLKIA
jgi:hypothetical protein